jgi:hypothetical protein
MTPPDASPPARSPKRAPQTTPVSHAKPKRTNSHLANLPQLQPKLTGIRLYEKATPYAQRCKPAKVGERTQNLRASIRLHKCGSRPGNVALSAFRLMGGFTRNARQTLPSEDVAGVILVLESAGKVKVKT